MNTEKNRYKVYTWKNGSKLHWILNPVFAINELILGRRVPKISLEDNTMDASKMERIFVPCPHCETLHKERTWSTQNGKAFKNWFGLFCKNCGNTIPCLTNGLSFLILVLTFPIWVWFRKSWKAKWLEKQPERYENFDTEFMANPLDRKSWIRTGLTWGAFMFLIMSIVSPYFHGERIDWRTLLGGLIIWTIGGLGFGYIMRFMYKGDS